MHALGRVQSASHHSGHIQHASATAYARQLRRPAESRLLLLQQIPDQHSPPRGHSGLVGDGVKDARVNAYCGLFQHQTQQGNPSRSGKDFLRYLHCRCVCNEYTIRGLLWERRLFSDAGAWFQQYTRRMDDRPPSPFLCRICRRRTTPWTMPNFAAKPDMDGDAGAFRARGGSCFAGEHTM
jgi:hypothetical protein